MVFISFRKSKGPKRVHTPEKVKRIHSLQKALLQRSGRIQKEFDSTSGAKRMATAVEKYKKRIAKLQKKKPSSKNLAKYNSKLRLLYLGEYANRLLYWYALKDFAEEKKANPKFIKFIEQKIKEEGSTLQTIQDEF